MPDPLETELAEIDRRAEAGRPQRRYRRRRYREDIGCLRPVTAEIRRAFAERVPSRTGASDELICFAVGPGRDDGERLAIASFGDDRACHVVDLGYRPGYGDVERLAHRIDLPVMKATAARRVRRRASPSNELEMQLLIRFIVDLNHQLPEGDGRLTR